jgi:hypothetical protein
MGLEKVPYVMDKLANLNHAKTLPWMPVSCASGINYGMGIRQNVFNPPTPPLQTFSMGHCKSPSTETASLLPSQGTTSKPPLKFPLGLVPESVRPYLELIRLEKVRIMIFHHPLTLTNSLPANRNKTVLLAVR